jgi:hypothetical protein
LNVNSNNAMAKSLVDVLFVVFVSLCIVNAAEIRVAHASPDAPPVDVAVNGTRAINRIAFGEISFYNHVDNGPAHIQVFPVGGTTPVIDATVNLVEGPTTIAAVDVLAKIAPDVVTDDNRRPDQGNSAVRFFHVSPNAPAVDIAVRGSTTPIFSNVAFKTATKYVQVKAGPYALQVKLAGTQTVVLEANAFLEEGRIHTIWAEGLVSGTPALRAVISRDF